MGNWVIRVGEWRESFPNINCVLKTYSKKSDYHNICYKEKAVYEANRHPPSLSPPSTPLMPVTVLVMQSLSRSHTQGKKETRESSLFSSFYFKLLKMYFEASFVH